MNNIITKNSFFILLAGIFSLAVLLSPYNAHAAFSCAGDVMTQDEFHQVQRTQVKVQFSVSGTTARATIVNQTNCSVPVSFISYKVYDQNISNQRYFNSTSGTVAPNSSLNLNVSLPSCMAQIDAYFGQAPTTPGNASWNWNILIDGQMVGQSGGTNWNNVSGNFCRDNPPPPPPPPPPPVTLNGSCTVNPASANIGSNVSWNASATGGSGSYTYSWSGTDGLFGSSANISKSYSSIGTKIGTITITSGSQSVSRSCSTVVTQTPSNTLDGSCTANPNSVNVGGSINWSSSATGGNGSYTYTWTGTDGLTGNSSNTSQSYSSAGSKTANVVITSGSQSVVRSCSAVVNQNFNNSLAVSCNANPSYLSNTGSINWLANATGGNGSYNYTWTGTDGLYGNSSSVSNYYSSPGTKYGYVTVTSNGQSANATCQASVGQNYNNNLYVSCYANPSNVQVGSQINWYANVSGSNNNYYGNYGNYYYIWSGTDGLNSSNQSPYMTYYSPGSKSATVTVRDNNGQTATAYCNAYVNQNSVLAFNSQLNQTPLTGAVYLSQIPYTGLADNIQLIVFLSVLVLFSAWLAYAMTSYQKRNGESA